MKEETEELSVDEVLSSIKKAVLNKKSSSAVLKNENKEELVLTEAMEVKSPLELMREDEFGEISKNLLQKYTKVFAMWKLLKNGKK